MIKKSSMGKSVSKHDKNKSSITTLAVFDFDDTLFNSPEAPKNFKGNWHISPQSLPEFAHPKDWKEDIVKKAQELCSSETVYCVMMTGRVGNIFADKIDGFLKSVNLSFDKTFYNEFGGHTAEYKIREINNLLGSLPNVQKIVMWDDDREKAEQYKQQFANGPQQFKINIVDDASTKFNIKKPIIKIKIKS